MQRAINPPTNRSFFRSLNIIAKLPITVPQLLTSEKCGSQLCRSRNRNWAVSSNEASCYAGLFLLLCGFFWWGWIVKLCLHWSISLMLKRCIYSVQETFTLHFQNMYEGQRWPSSSLPPHSITPFLPLAFHQYTNANPVPFQLAQWFLRKGPCRRMEPALCLKSLDFSGALCTTVALAGGHFGTLLLLLEGGRRIMVWRR